MKGKIQTHDFGIRRQSIEADRYRRLALQAIRCLFVASFNPRALNGLDKTAQQKRSAKPFRKIQFANILLQSTRSHTLPRKPDGVTPRPHTIRSDGFLDQKTIPPYRLDVTLTPSNQKVRGDEKNKKTMKLHPPIRPTSNIVQLKKTRLDKTGIQLRSGHSIEQLQHQQRHLADPAISLDSLIDQAANVPQSFTKASGNHNDGTVVSEHAVDKVGLVHHQEVDAPTKVYGQQARRVGMSLAITAFEKLRSIIWNTRIAAQSDREVSCGSSETTTCTEHAQSPKLDRRQQIADLIDTLSNQQLLLRNDVCTTPTTISSTDNNENSQALVPYSKPVGDLVAPPWIRGTLDLVASLKSRVADIVQGLGQREAQEGSVSKVFPPMTLQQRIQSTAVEQTLAENKFWLTRHGPPRDNSYEGPSPPLQLIASVMGRHVDCGTMTERERRKATEKLHGLATFRANNMTYPHSIQKIWTLGGCSSSWHKTRLALCEIRRSPFKTPLQKDRLIYEIRDVLIDRLLIRFGIFKQMECRVIKTKLFKDVATVWASYLVERYEFPLEAATPYYIPDEVILHKTVQELSAVNTDLYWLLYRVQRPALSDTVPVPHYPKHFESKMDEIPFAPERLNQLTKFYGLVKWPFIHPKDSKMLKNKLV